MNNTFLLSILVIFASTTLRVNGQTPQVKATFKKNEKAVMDELLDYSRPGPNHAILGKLAGNWAFQDKNLSFIKGTISRRSIYEGRFYVVEITGGKLEIPVADGQMKLENYQEMEIEGYDNIKKSFVTSSINNHIGSNIDLQLGRYNPATKALTYEWDSELRLGIKVKKQKVLHIVDDSHYTETFYEEQSGTKKITRNLEYVRVSEK